MDTKDLQKFANYGGVKLTFEVTRHFLLSHKTAERFYSLSALAMQTCVCHGAHKCVLAKKGRAVDNAISARHQSTQFVLREQI